MHRRRRFIALGILALIVGMGILAVLKYRMKPPGIREGDAEAFFPPAVHELLSAPEEGVTPTPNISLQIGGASDPAFYRGTPLILAVNLANHRAVNAHADNAAIHSLREGLRDMAGKGKIPKERVQQLLAEPEKMEPIPVVQLGDRSVRWDQFIHFRIRMPDGKLQALPWALRLVAAPQPGPLVLDAKATAELKYALDPAAAQGIVAGDYNIVAVIEVPSAAGLSKASWRGQVEATPIKLKIMDAPPVLPDSGEEKRVLQFAEYFSEIGDYAQTLSQAQRVLQLNAQSIPALILTGEADEGRGDKRGALNAHQRASQAFYRQSPQSREPPIYLIERIQTLQDALR